MLQPEEVAKHNTVDDLWVIVEGQAYDLSEFAPEHPGGMAILKKYAGKDATDAYLPIHPPGTLETYLPKDKHLGPVDMSSVVAEVKEETQEEKDRQERLKSIPPLSEILSLHDFEAVAKSVLPTSAWAYYSSGADDEITMRENRDAYSRVWLRPRILRDVTHVAFDTTMLGSKSSLPIYATATALGKLGNPKDGLGEVHITQACAQTGTIQMIPTLASCSFDQMVDAAEPGQPLWMQLYVNKDREITRKIVQHAEKRGISGLFITVDAPQLGRREKDMRQKFAEEEHGSSVQKQAGDKVESNQGAARAISSFIDPGLSWADLDWFKSITKMPICLKGVQCWEDAVLAAEAGCAAIVLSNHGGRQLDLARSGIDILAEVMPELRQRGLDKKMEVYIDGGVRRAADVIKAVALGAKGVGIGRPFIYAYSCYGTEGLVHAINILKDEFTMDMRLLGATTIDEITPEMVDATLLSRRGTGAQRDALFEQNYEQLSGVGHGLGGRARL